MAAKEFKRKLTTILSANVKGYSRQISNIPIKIRFCLTSYLTTTSATAQEVKRDI